MPKYLDINEFLEKFKQHEVIKLLIHIPLITDISTKTLLNFTVHDHIFLSYFYDNKSTNMLHAYFDFNEKFYTRFYIYMDSPRKTNYYYSRSNLLDDEFFRKLIALFNSVTILPLNILDKEFWHDINHFVRTVNDDKILACNIIENEIKIMTDVVKDIRVHKLETTYTSLTFPRMWLVFYGISKKELEEFVKFVINKFINPINRYVEFLFQFTYSRSDKRLILHLVPKKIFEGILSKYFKVVIASIFEKFENRMIIPNVVVNCVIDTDIKDINYASSGDYIDEIIDLYRRISDIMF